WHATPLLQSSLRTAPGKVWYQPVTQKRAFPSCDSRVIAARAKHAAMPITIMNNVIHIARLLFHERKNLRRGSPAKETREGRSGSRDRRQEPNRIEDVRSASNIRRSSSRNSR